MGVGYTPPVVQLKEFLYTPFPASDGMIGSVPYFTATPHAIHAFPGIHRPTTIYTPLSPLPEYVIDSHHTHMISYSWPIACGDVPLSSEDDIIFITIIQ